MHWSLLTLIGVSGTLAVVYGFSRVLNWVLPVDAAAMGPNTHMPRRNAAERLRELRQDLWAAAVMGIGMYAVIFAYLVVLAVGALITVWMVSAWGVLGLLAGIVVSGILILVLASVVIDLVTGRSR
jgi:uncharacterized membrane protein